MFKKIAYMVVLKDLCKCNMLIGKYDAKHGKQDFMYGVNMVMEDIAYSISQETGDRFSNIFFKNMAKSEKNA